MNVPSYIHGGRAWREGIQNQIDRLTHDHKRLTQAVRVFVTRLNAVAGELKERVEALERRCPEQE